jgi:prepilin-type N-terminal cleavage/methylation domain-containing protein
MRNQKPINQGFTLIELLVVVAIISLLSSIALIALMSARQKSRDVKRLSDMTQMNTALELYFAANKGYPTGTVDGIPQTVAPTFASQIPKPPTPPDGGCEAVNYPSPVPAGYNGSSYYYYPSGTSQVVNGVTIYPDYAYYFCLGNTTGNFGPGMHILTPGGVK